MDKNSRIKFDFNVLKGRLKMDSPYSKYLMFCIATGLLLYLSTPFINAVANILKIYH